MEKMKRFKRRLSQTLRGSHTIDESLSELAEQMTIEENGLKDSGELHPVAAGQKVAGGMLFTCYSLDYLIYASKNYNTLEQSMLFLGDADISMHLSQSYV